MDFGDQSSTNFVCNKAVPSSHNIIVQGDELTIIGNYFLFFCSGLTSLDLSDLQKVTSIGNRFLYDCSQLNEVAIPVHFSALDLLKESYVQRIYCASKNNLPEELHHKYKSLDEWGTRQGSVASASD